VRSSGAGLLAVYTVRQLLLAGLLAVCTIRQLLAGLLAVCTVRQLLLAGLLAVCTVRQLLLAGLDQRVRHEALVKAKISCLFRQPNSDSSGDKPLAY
jgi:hypothetical protein